MAQEYVKISELDPTSSFGSNDQFVIVQNEETVKISGVDLIDSLVTQANLASRSFVTAVVDTAPETLNTLKELAAALNDDANFASTITNLIATKLSITDFGSYFWNEVTKLNTYHIAEGSNLYFTEQRVLDIVNPLIPTSFVTSYNDLTDKPVLFSGAYEDLTGKPTATTFTTVTATQLNVQNIDFTGVGAVTIKSGNDLNLSAAGKIILDGELDNVTIICDEY